MTRAGHPILWGASETEDFADEHSVRGDAHDFLAVHSFSLVGGLGRSQRPALSAAPFTALKLSPSGACSQL